MKSYFEKIAAATTDDIMDAIKNLAKTKGPKPLRTALAFGLGSLGITGIGLAGAAGYEAAKDAINNKVFFNRMLRDNPDLRDKKDSVKPYFNTLMRFAPDAAADPLTSGAFVRRQAEFPGSGLPIADVKTMVDIGKDMKVTRMHPVRDTLASTGNLSSDLMKMTLFGG